MNCRLVDAAAKTTFVRVRLLSDDVGFEEDLRMSIDNVGALDVTAHDATNGTQALATEVVVVDAEASSSNTAQFALWRAQNRSAVTVVAAPQIDSDVRFFGASGRASAYLKKGNCVAGIAALVVELASIGQSSR